MPKKRLQRTVEEETKEWTDNVWHRFITEKKALGAVPETIQTYEYGYKKFCRYFGDRVEYIRDPQLGVKISSINFSDKAVENFNFLLPVAVLVFGSRMNDNFVNQGI